MGTANRERRRRKEKARKQKSSTPPRATTWDDLWGEVAPPTIEDQVADEISRAVHTLDRDDRAGFSRAAARLSTDAGRAGWRRAVDRVLTEHLRAMVTEAWGRGWQPVDLVRVVGRNLAAAHVRLARDAIAAELTGYPRDTIDPRWSAQLAEVQAAVWWPADRTFLQATADQRQSGWADLVPTALELLLQLGRLPALQPLGPLPGKARTSDVRAAAAQHQVDERILSRVRALLAKAESTTFPAEAETFTAGAQSLMARHSIDQALLAASSPTAATQDPIGRRIGIDNPYEGPKVMLLNAVAEANRCRTVWSGQFGFSTVIGFATDLNAVEVLFTSLLVQATTAMTRAGSRTDAGGRSRTRAFRQSFLISYAHRIGERLNQATATQTEQAAAEPSGRSLLPVLASRDEAVEETLTQMFPQLSSVSLGAARDREGWVSGRAAADLATLQTGASLPG